MLAILDSDFMIVLDLDSLIKIKRYVWRLLSRVTSVTYETISFTLTSLSYSLRLVHVKMMADVAASVG